MNFIGNFLANFISFNSIKLFFVFKIFVNCLCGFFACSHCKNDGCGTGYRISAGIYTFYVGGAGVFIDNNSAPFLSGQPRVVEAINGFGVWPMAIITVSTSITCSDPGFGTGLLLPDSSGSPSFHLYALHAFDPAVVGAKNSCGVCKEFEQNSFFLCVRGALRKPAAMGRR